ncbi:MAG TPA: FAD-dependent oxidoreductase [Polyangia bacterium]|jgi:NADPH-dependent glutamate synthase beta subunit-like oxidoreductase/NAD(P)H-flavin reductase|nr:FAD-dependent oxidoreductase [Polyangia bacterium]
MFEGFAFAAGKGSAPESGERNFGLAIDEFRYGDLYEPGKLAELDKRFRAELAAADAELAKKFEAYRAGEMLTPPQESELLIAVARPLGTFVARLFRVEKEHQALVDRAAREDVIFRMKTFIARRAIKKYPETAPPAETAATLRTQVRSLCATAFPELIATGDDELTFATVLAVLLAGESKLDAGKESTAPGTPAGDELGRRQAREQLANRLDLFERWAAVHRFEPSGRAAVKGWVSFQVPHNVDHHDLVPLRRPDAQLPNVTDGPSEHRRRRDGFALTDARMSAREVANESDYCMYCHEREKDSCSKGMHDKHGTLKRNPLGVALAGCPLNEKIGEMHVLRKGGDSIAALAVVVIDNPMVPGTGHRICNDCMKGCIFQKQEPVNIPQAETGVLTDVLGLPWGFEIYGLLTRWNPLNRARPFALPYRGRNVLVVGLGPAGYTLCQHLLNDGFGVVGVDGLKIEPLRADLLGADAWPPRAVKSWSELSVPLDERPLAGFGGVAEYGITVRWDKNFLTALYLTLARRATFRVYGGVRFGGTLDVEGAFALGFDHVALAAGAGKPTIIDVKNNLIRGVRKASDFLMALQLTGGFKKDSLANLQVRLPALVIGGGLTGIDTTTEAAAYYPVQVEKFLARWEALVADNGGDEAAAFKVYDAEEAAVAREFLEHGRAVRAERARAAAAGEAPDFATLVNAWGGVSLVYRRALKDSPAYRLNHEEITKFHEEGVRFIEKLSPAACIPDETGALAAVEFERHEPLGDDGNVTWKKVGDNVRLPARSLFVAAGTQPNITYEHERPGTFQVEPRTKSFRPFVAVRSESGHLQLRLPHEGEVGFFTSYLREGRTVSFYGDNHPVYAGSVVRAMASARDGAPHVAELFAGELRAQQNEGANGQPAREAAWTAFTAKLDDELRATVVRVDRLTPTIVDVIVRAPAAARRFEPGQFFRLQDFEAHATAARGSRLAMEGLALTGAWVDKDKGLLSLIVLEMGGSSRQCATLAPGEPVVVMGPTGAPTEIPSGEAVVLCGGGLGNAVLFSIAKALREHGNKVLYFAAYRRREDIYKVEEIEAGTDQVIWSVDGGPLPATRRPQDRAFEGNVVQAMLAFAKGELGEARVPLPSCSRVIAIGSDRMMAAVKEARHGILAPHFKPGHVAIASINSPMQCMMKEICAQCLQKHVDPTSGKETIIFSCANQDQLQDFVDWKNLAARLRQNTVQEKLTDAWVRSLLAAG